MVAIASQITSLTIVNSTVYSDADPRKRQRSASLAFVWGIHRGPVNSPHKWPVTRKMFPFDDVIMACRKCNLHLDQDIEAWTKWPTLRRWCFQGHFRERNYHILMLISIELIAWQNVIIGSGIGLAPTTHYLNQWTNDDPVLGNHTAWLAHN